MRSLKETCGILLVVILLVACSKEQQRFLDENYWYIHSLKSVDSEQWELPDRRYELKLNVAGESYRLLNNFTLCLEEFGLGSNHGIYFNVTECKLECCDTPYGDTLVDILSKVDKWILNGDTLVLSGRDSLKFLPYL